MSLNISTGIITTQTQKMNHIKVAQKGDVIVRHLVLPGHLECCTAPALDLLEDLPNVNVNIMGQYKPEHMAQEYQEISKPLNNEEYQRALQMGKERGLMFV